MKNKGFTLVEIVISLVILVAIGLVIGSGLNHVFNKNSNDDKTTIVNRITSSADVYLSNNSTLLAELYSTKGYLIIKVADLIESGYLEDDIFDPETGEKIGANAAKDFVMVTLDVNGLLKFAYNPNEVKEGYLEAQTKNIEYMSKYVCNNLSTYLSNETDWGTPALRLINKDGSVYTGTIASVITGISCNLSVDASTGKANKPGTYQITYTYKLPDTQVSKSYTRTVIVAPDMNDIISLTATVNPTKVVINGSLTFTVKATNRKNEVKTLTASQYTVTSYSTATAGSYTATITYNGTNSDGTKPKTTVNYTVVDNVSEIIKADPDCTSQTDGSCWYIGEEDGNYISYSGKIWRIFQRVSNGSLRIILNSSAANFVFTDSYQYWNCSPESCCNSGYSEGNSYSYYTLSQNPNALNTYLKSNFYIGLTNNTTYLNNTKFNVGKYDSPSSAVVTQRVGLMSYTEYAKIASCSVFTCNSSYLKISSSWGLANYYAKDVFAETADVSGNSYGRNVNALKSQSLSVGTNGSISVVDGKYKVVSPSGTKASSNGTALGVRPVVELSSSVKISGGNGTASSPYVVN